MERTRVQRLARILRILVIITFICNIAALLLVPAVVSLNGEDVSRGTLEYLDGIFCPGEDDVAMARVMASLISWFWVWDEEYRAVLTLFLLFCGVCTAVVLWQARKVLDTILEGNPFQGRNGVSLHRAAVCSFLISAAALVRLLWRLIYYRSMASLLSYNTLFVPVFFMAGLLCLVMSALFRQAAELKAENDLTI